MNFRRLVIAAPLMMMTISMLGCGASPTATMQRAQYASGAQVLGKARAPQSKEDFVKALQAVKIKLTEDQLATIAKERVVVPSGVMAPRPAENLTADQNLDVHFNKHCKDFSPAITSRENYLAQGIDAGTGKRGEIRYFFDTTSFAKGYQTHVVRWNPKNSDFCAFRLDGAMTTYYRNFTLAPKRFIEVPAF